MKLAYMWHLWGLIKPNTELSHPPSSLSVLLTAPPWPWCSEMKTWNIRLLQSQWQLHWQQLNKILFPHGLHAKNKGTWLTTAGLLTHSLDQHIGVRRTTRERLQIKPERMPQVKAHKNLLGNMSLWLLSFPSHGNNADLHWNTDMGAMSHMTPLSYCISYCNIYVIHIYVSFVIFKYILLVY